MHGIKKFVRGWIQRQEPHFIYCQLRGEMPY